jgi:hypothetical protein
VRKDVRILGYFAKPKGVGEEKIDKTCSKQYDKTAPPSQSKIVASIKRMKSLVLNTEIISVYSENHTKRNILTGELLVM